VYDLPVNGPLSAFLRDGGNKAALTADVRLLIMCGLARAVHVLHNDGCSGSSFFHRDIQSENIYLTKDYKAQLMDCGLAKFVPIDSSTSTTMLVMNYPPATHVYTDPKFWENANTNPYSYQAAYDVYSIGVVLVELIVGCLIRGESHIPVPTNWEDLKSSAESDIGWSEDSLIIVCKAALGCMKAIDNRITTKHLVSQLHKSIASARKEKRQQRACSMCNFEGIHQECNKGHFICSSCLETEIGTDPSKSEPSCPMKDCTSSPFYLYGYIANGTYRSDRDDLREPVMQTYGLTKLIAEKHFKCPHLVRIYPVENQVRGNPWSDFMEQFVKQKFNVVFYCSRTRLPGHDPFVIELKKEWIAKLTPWVKMSFKVLTGVAFPALSPIWDLFPISKELKLFDDDQEPAGSLPAQNTIALEKFDRARSYAGEALIFIEAQANKRVNAEIWKPMMELCADDTNRTAVWVKKGYVY
jgi:hypothetical protein